MIGCEECLSGARKRLCVGRALIDGICDSEVKDHLSLLMLRYHLPVRKQRNSDVSVLSLTIKRFMKGSLA